MLDDPTNLARRLYAENLRLRELLAAVAQELERLAAAFSRETVWAGGVPVRGYSVRTNEWRYTEWISDGKRIAASCTTTAREALETRDVAEQP